MSIFTKNKRIKIPRSKHNLSHSNILTMGPCRLVPINVEELAPTEKIGYRFGYSMFTDALFAPVMQDMRVCVRDFIVPHRLLFHGFEDFVTMSYVKDKDGVDVIKVPESPYTTTTDIVTIVENNGSLKPLADYMRYKYGNHTTSNVASSGLKNKHITLLPLVAYAKIYLDWFNDETFGYDGKRTFDSLLDALDNIYVGAGLGFNVYYPDGSYVLTNVLTFLFTLRYVAQPKNYFTSAMTAQQKGPSVKVPYSGSRATVLFNTDDGSDIPSTSSRMFPYVPGAGNPETEEFGVVSPYNGSTISVLGHLYADLASVDSPTIVEYRTREALQRFLERNQTGGTRYVEFLRAHFGSKLPDPFAQRSQYLHGCKFSLSSQPVFSHSETSIAQDETTLLGDYAGKLESRNTSSYCGYFTKEHCYHITLAYVQVPISMGIEGLPRVNTRTKALDYLIPEFSNVGEQPINSSEMYMDVAFSVSDIFGYTPRFADFKSHYNEVHGDFLSSLNYWHAGLLGSGSAYQHINFNLIHAGAGSNVSRMFSTNLLDPFRFWFYFDYHKTSPCTR